MNSGHRRILLLASCLLLVLNYPWLAIFAKQTLLFGLPLLHLYLFVLWFAIILTVRFLLNAEDAEPPANSPDRRSARETDDAAK
jgi:TRAP-type C4-dicarboxylate transport system permease small subunit